MHSQWNAGLHMRAVKATRASLAEQMRSIYLPVGLPLCLM